MSEEEKDSFRDGIRKRLTRIEEASLEHNNSFITFLRTITTIATGTLGLLVALRPAQIQSQIATGLFLGSLSLLGVCILSSIVSQYFEVVYFENKVTARMRMLQEYVHSHGSDAFQTPIKKDKPILYRISDILTFGCLSLSIITLIAYVSVDLACK